jgi:hypothetical protein
MLSYDWGSRPLSDPSYAPQRISSQQPSWTTLKAVFAVKQQRGTDTPEFKPVAQAETYDQMYYYISAFSQMNLGYDTLQHCNNISIEFLLILSNFIEFIEFIWIQMYKCSCGEGAEQGREGGKFRIEFLLIFSEFIWIQMYKCVVVVRGQSREGKGKSSETVGLM